MTHPSAFLSPALKVKAPGYPFGDTVPLRVEMQRTCMPPVAIQVDPDHFPIAYTGVRYDCYVGSNGVLAVILPRGQMLLVEHDAIKVVAVHSSLTSDAAA